MTEFFSSTRPGQKVFQGNLEFELPILYFRDDLFIMFLTGSYSRIKAAMPSPHLHPVSLFGGKALVGIAAFNYFDTSIGPYGEIGVILPAVYAHKPPPPLLPGLLESKYPGFGTLVMHLPVTKTDARDAGRGEWGYTKFLASMKFVNTPEFHQVEMTEGPRHILTLRVAKKGILKHDKKPLVTYSVRNRSLIMTTILQKGICRMSFSSKDSFLTLGDHEVSETIRVLGLSRKPIMTRYYMERSGILPAGQVIEKNVAPLDGYFGTDHEGKHETHYFE
jgi:hypothetical protein